MQKRGLTLGNGEVPSGLSEEEARRRLETYGENVLPSGKRLSPAAMLIAQVKSPLVYVVLSAAMVSLLMGEIADFIIITAVVMLDVVLGFLQEYQANRTYESLKALVKPVATVIRDGERKEIEARHLVPGDTVVVESGEKVPADGQMIQAYAFSVDEGVLTGESEARSLKAGDPVHMGAIVLTGRGIMTVTATGSATELGKIASSLAETPEEETPLQRRLRGLSRTLVRIVAAVTLVLFSIGVGMGRPVLEMVRVSVILAVAAIPEGLPVAVTMILVIGMKNILRRQGLVRKLLAVETLGSVTTICTDKTGTLTEGRMKVSRWDLACPDEARLVAVLNNDLSDPLEVSLWEFAREYWGVEPQELVSRCPRLDETPFSSESRYMKSLHLVEGKGLWLLKGAPETVLEMCEVPQGEARRLRSLWEDWASRGLKLLALAFRSEEEISGRESGRYTWAGLLGIEDPVRVEVPGAIETCRKAGVKVKILTGDHKRTALNVAAAIGLEVCEDSALEGADLEQMDDDALEKRIDGTVVFSRITPHQKLRIVRALQKRGEVVAMVGDGVNDAPALKKADIGVVVGNATDVAKETADLVLLDSNFKTIVDAVEQGRVIFQNIRKVVSYTLSNSFAEILLMFAAMMLKWPVPLTVAQILWVHLICDGPVDVALGFEPSEPGIMEEKPLARDEPFLDRLGLGLIGGISLSAAAGCLYQFSHYWRAHRDLVLARTFTFETLAVISLVYVFAYRSMRRSLFHAGHLLANKPLIVFVGLGLILAFLPVTTAPLGAVLDVKPLGAGEWLLVFGISFGLLILVELGKGVALSRRKGRNSPL